MRLYRGGVAFFDSGIGGLTVLAECRKKLPQEVFYYYGDNARAPYGNLPTEVISRYVREAFEVFRALNVKGAVTACNTATAVCVESLRTEYSFPIVGAEPAVFSAAARGGEVLVLATRATRTSARFLKLCERARARYPKATILAPHCDELAGAIEKNLLAPSFDYSPFLPSGNPCSVVLGCTHYIYIKKQIENFYGCEAVDGNAGIANRLFSFVCPNGGILREHRDGQPLVTPPFAREGENALRFDYADGFFAPIFFLGAQKERNYTVFKQMFGNSGNKRG